MEKYRPSNATEGHAFMARYCEHCAYGVGQALNPCMIVGATMAFDIDDPEYPIEWVRDESGPRCTAFMREGEQTPSARCQHTVDMFASPDDGAHRHEEAAK